MKYLRKFNELDNGELWKYIGDLQDANPIMVGLDKPIDFTKSGFSMVKNIIDKIIEKTNKKINLSLIKKDYLFKSYITISEESNERDFHLFLLPDEYFLLEDQKEDIYLAEKPLYYYYIDGYDGLQDIMEEIFKK